MSKFEERLEKKYGWFALIFWVVLAIALGYKLFEKFIL